MATYRKTKHRVNSKNMMPAGRLSFFKPLSITVFIVITVMGFGIWIYQRQINAINTVDDIEQVITLKNPNVERVHLSKSEFTNHKTGAKWTEYSLDISGIVEDLSGLDKFKFYNVRISYYGEHYRSKPVVVKTSLLEDIHTKELVICNYKFQDIDNLNDVLKSVGMKVLMLEGKSFTDVKFLKGIELTELVLSHTSVTELSPLTGESLKQIRISDSPQIDLTGIDKLNLVELRLERTPVQDVSIIADCSTIQALTLNNVGITGFPPISDLSELRKLNVNHNKITKLPDELPKTLRTMEIAGNPIADISSLKKLGLHNLNLGWTKVKDLDALKGMPLYKLEICSTAISDLSPLNSPNLDTLWCSDTPIEDLSPLAKLTNLRHLLANGIKATDFSPLIDIKFSSLSLRNTAFSDPSIIKICNKSQLPYDKK